MDFLNSSLRLFTFSRIEVRLHILYLLWMGFQFFDVLGDGRALRMQAIWLAVLFAIILLHEFGHCFGARAVGGDADQILMWPLGGLAFARAPMTPWAQFVTVAAGPLVNVGLCLLSGLLLIVSTGRPLIVGLNPWRPLDFGLMTEPWQLYVGIFYHINYLLLVFNLLPIFPLDGGQLFRVLLWRFVELARATIIAAQVGIVGAVALGMLGVNTGQWILIGIAVFGGFTSYQTLQAARHGFITEDFVATRVARNRRRESAWSRFRRKLSRGAQAHENPNPGGWERRQAEVHELEREVDRILKKVHDHGIQSLSFVERQTLERATRERQRREAELRHGP
jgi:Zn-dependent protease